MREMRDGPLRSDRKGALYLIVFHDLRKSSSPELSRVSCYRALNPYLILATAKKIRDKMKFYFSGSRIAGVANEWSRSRRKPDSKPKA